MLKDTLEEREFEYSHCIDNLRLIIIMILVNLRDEFNFNWTLSYVARWFKYIDRIIRRSIVVLFDGLFSLRFIMVLIAMNTILAYLKSWLKRCACYISSCSGAHVLARLSEWYDFSCFEFQKDNNIQRWVRYLKRPSKVWIHRRLPYTSTSLCPLHCSKFTAVYISNQM